MDYLAFENGIIRDARYQEEVAFERLRDDEPKRHRLLNRVLGASSMNSRSAHGKLICGTPPFIPTPSQIVFENFEVGVEHTVVITFTNITGGFSTFRLLPITPKYKDVFKTSYTPPPRICAGLSWKIAVSFTPITNDDIVTELSVKCEDGVFSIPIKALRKRALITVEPENVDFGTVVIGDRKREVITLRNSGASAGSIWIGGTFRKEVEKIHRDPVSEEGHAVFSIVPMVYHVTLPPFSVQEFELQFIPHEDAVLSCTILFSDASEKVANELEVRVHGKSTNSPVYVSSPDIRFNWCFFDCGYRQEVVVTNSSNVPATVTPDISSEMQSVVLFEPSVVCIQPHCSLSLMVQFSPHNGMDPHFECTIFLTVHGQPLPAMVHISAMLTERKPLVDECMIDYGTLAVNVEKILTVGVTNQSDLPQVVGFLNVPSNITATPEAATLLPKERYSFRLGVIPSCVGPFTQKLTLTNEYGDRVGVDIAGVGVEPILKFSHCTISLPPCPMGGRVGAVTVLTNTTDEARHFSFDVSSPYVHVSPSTGSLLSGEYTPIAVFFAPPMDISLPVEPILDPFSGKGNKDSPRWKVSSRDEAHLSPFVGWEGDEGAAVRWHKRTIVRVQCRTSEADALPSFLAITCIVIKPEAIGCALLSLKSATDGVVAKVQEKVLKGVKRRNNSPHGVSDVLDVSPSGHHLDIDFGSASLNYAMTRTCFVKNCADVATLFQLRPVNPLSPFTVLHVPLTPVPPLAEETVVVQYRPTEHGIHTDTLCLASGLSHDIVISLRGTCCPTDMILSLEASLDVSSGHSISVSSLVFPATQVRDTSSVPLYCYNVGSFPIDVSIRLDTSPEDWNARQTFVFYPSAFTVLPKGKVACTALFSPQHEGVLSLSVLVNVGSKEERLTLSGRGCGGPIYFVPPPTVPHLVSRNCGDIVTGYAEGPARVFPAAGCASGYPLQLHFCAGESKAFLIGSVVGGPSVECHIGMWDDAYASSGWVVGPMKLPVAPGGQGVLTISLNLKAAERGSLVTSCTFTMILKCSSDPSNDRVYYVRCTT